MRSAIVIGLALLTCGCQSARDLPAEQRQVQHVHDVPGMTKDQVYVRAAVWFTKNFHDSKSVIRFQDQDSGTIVGWGITPGVLGLMRYDLAFTLRFEAKDGLYRTTFDGYELVDLADIHHDLNVGDQLRDAKDACTKIDADLASAIEERPWGK